jgi:hypothetical protein
MYAPGPHGVIPTDERPPQVGEAIEAMHALPEDGHEADNLAMVALAIAGILDAVRPGTATLSGDVLTFDLTWR